MATAKETALVAIKRLRKIIPKATLEVKQKEVFDIVKKTPDNELHTTFIKAKGFFKIFEGATKEAFVERAKKAKEKSEKIETDVGVITFVSRSNFSFDEKGIDKFLKGKNLNEELVYDYSYTVNTKDARVLANLLDKGHVIVKKKLSIVKINDLAETYPSVLNYVEDEPTEFVKGL